MNKHYLSIEQMKNLQALGLDCSKASLRYEQYGDKDKNGKYIFDNNWQQFLGYNNAKNCANYRVVPCFDLQDVLEILPKEIDDVPIKIGFNGNSKEWDIYYYSPDIPYVQEEMYIAEITNKELIDVAYNMLVWCIKNKKIEL